MPRISEFYGISIYMYYKDHPPPHFHAIYGDSEAVIELNGPNLIEGDLPRRALAMVLEWAQTQRQQLEEDWNLARAGAPLNRIDPLP